MTPALKQISPKIGLMKTFFDVEIDSTNQDVILETQLIN